MAKNFVRSADFNNNFSGSADPINVMDSDLGKKIVGITDSNHNCSRTADLSMAASTDLALKLRGSTDPVPPFTSPYNVRNKNFKTPAVIFAPSAPKSRWRRIPCNCLFICKTRVTTLPSGIIWLDAPSLL